MKFGMGLNAQLRTKIRGVKVQNDICMYVQTYIQTNKHPRFSIVLPLRVSHSLANKKKSGEKSQILALRVN